MRGALLGVYFVENRESRREFVRASTQITHRDPRAEVAAKAPVALVSQSLARAYWQGQSPLGVVEVLDLHLQQIRSLAVRVVTSLRRPGYMNQCHCIRS